MVNISINCFCFLRTYKILSAIINVSLSSTNVITVGYGVYNLHCVYCVSVTGWGRLVWVINKFKLSSLGLIFIIHWKLKCCQYVSFKHMSTGLRVTCYLIQSSISILVKFAILIDNSFKPQFWVKIGKNERSDASKLFPPKL